MRFYVGIHQPADVPKLGGEPVMLSAHRLRSTRHAAGVLQLGRWMLDSGAFSEVTRHGGFRTSPWYYAQEIAWYQRFGQLDAAVAQDYMCEPETLRRTGLTVAEHQRRTIARYDALLAERPPVYVLPVLQGATPAEYRAHVRDYGGRLELGAWVGVGSVCKRQGRPAEVREILDAIHAERPDLRLHGFGVKLTALADPGVWRQLASADSMAWSYAAWRQGRNGNAWREARAFAGRVRALAP